jgi:hypothetical protein
MYLKKSIISKLDPGERGEIEQAFMEKLSFVLATCISLASLIIALLAWFRA